MTNIANALRIDGWMSPEELRWLAEQATKYSCIVEVGSYLGRSTRALADNAKGVVYAIDDWYGPRDVEIPEEERGKVFEQFQKNMDGLQGRLNVVTSDHATATIDQSPDMVFIDGSHIYEDVKRDILHWIKYMQPGGLICGHDAYDIGVSLAIADVFKSPIYIADRTSIWFHTLPIAPFFKRSFSSQ